MNVLIVEDDRDKSSAIKSFFENEYVCNKIMTKKSISSGLLEIINNNIYDIISLDMSMTAYDITDDDPTGGGVENFGGCEFLEQMYLREIYIPVIVISQLSTFGNGAQRKTLSSLNDELVKKYPDFYKGSIFYTTANQDWKNELTEKINEINNEET